MLYYRLYEKQQTKPEEDLIVIQIDTTGSLFVKNEEKTDLQDEIKKKLNDQIYFTFKCSY